MKLSHPSIRWTPQRDGDRFCSPACGRGCTFQEFEDATNKGKALAELLGPQWTPRVWENLGWFHAAILDCEEAPGVYIEVYGPTIARDKYWIDARFPEQFHGTFDDPVKGILTLISSAKKKAARLEAHADLLLKLQAK